MSGRVYRTVMRLLIGWHRFFFVGSTAIYLCHTLQFFFKSTELLSTMTYAHSADASIWQFFIIGTKRVIVFGDSATRNWIKSSIKKVQLMNLKFESNTIIYIYIDISVMTLRWCLTFKIRRFWNSIVLKKIASSIKVCNIPLSLQAFGGWVKCHFWASQNCPTTSISHLHFRVWGQFFWIKNTQFFVVEPHRLV